jgi:hypothetical protein
LRADESDISRLAIATTTEARIANPSPTTTFAPKALTAKMMAAELRRRLA